MSGTTRLAEIMRELQTLRADNEKLRLDYELLSDDYRNLVEDNRLIRVDVERLQSTNETYTRRLMRVTNFPSHPGSHAADRASEADSPPDWRDGWCAAAWAIQEAIRDEVE